MSKVNNIQTLTAMMEYLAVDMLICVDVTSVYFKNSNNSDITKTLKVTV